MNSEIKARQDMSREKLHKLVPNLKAKSGIYIYTRVDEYGKRYSYVGLSVNIEQRLMQHDMEYESHIDKSIKKHGYFNEGKPHGWKIECTYYPTHMLNDIERQEIARMGKTHELLNTTAGGQDAGKIYLKPPAPRKGYRQGLTIGEARGYADGEKKGYKQGRLDGIAEGRRTLASELQHILDFHLIISVVKDTIPHNKALEKFLSLLSENAKQNTANFTNEENAE